MATQKPAILSANFFRAVRSCRPQTYRSIRSRSTSTSAHAVRRNELHTSAKRQQQDQGYQRYGPAATPSMPPPPKPTEPFLPSTEQTQKDASEFELKKMERKKLEAQEQAEQNPAEEAPERTSPADTQSVGGKASEPVALESELLQAVEPKPEPNADQQVETAQTQSQDHNHDLNQPFNPPEVDDGPLPNRELDIVLSIPSPSEIKGGDGHTSHHPHLEASPYEHHFDTYTLVQDLCKEIQDSSNGSEASSTFTDEQAVTLMKAIRLMLAQNLDLAKDGLVSKSDTENETYLFRAACSELKTTMQTARFMEAQKQRSQRAQVQHEFDILNQKVSQDIMTMREELKGMFNDRKLGLQEEKRQVDGKIQGLSYRISVDLNSEAKSEVEGLRWVLTRRAAMAILAAASMTLAFLQYYSVESRKQVEIEKKKRAVQRDQEERFKKEQERFGNGGGTMGRSTGSQTDGIVLGGTAGVNYDGSMS